MDDRILSRGYSSKRGSSLFTNDPAGERKSGLNLTRCKSQPIPQPAIVKSKMLPVRESFGDPNQRSSYKMELYLVRGTAPGYYLPPETRNMFLTFSKHCGSDGYHTEEKHLPNGNITYILEKNNRSPRSMVTEPRSLTSVGVSVLGFDITASETQYGGMMLEEGGYMGGSVPQLTQCSYNQTDGTIHDTNYYLNSVQKKPNRIHESVPPSTKINGGPWDIELDSNSSDVSHCLSDAGTIVWAPGKERQRHSVTRAVAHRLPPLNDEACTSPTTPRELSSSFPTKATRIAPVGFVEKRSSTKSIRSPGAPLVLPKYVMPTDKRGFYNNASEERNVVYCPPKARAILGLPEQTSATVPLASLERKTKQSLNIFTRIFSKPMQQSTQPATKQLKSDFIETDSLYSPPSSANSTAVSTFSGSNYKGSSSPSTRPSTPLQNHVFEKKDRPRSFLSAEMELRLQRARAAVESLSENGETRYSPIRTLSYSSLQAQRGQASQESSSSASYPEPEASDVDHFQEYMTHFDLNNSTNPPANGFMESDDSSADSDTGSVDTILPLKPAAPHQPRQDLQASTKKEAGKSGEIPRPRRRRVKKEKPLKKYIFHVADNFEELLAQAPTPPPTRPLPPIPIGPQPPNTLRATPPRSTPKVVPTQSPGTEQSPRITGLMKEYRDYLNNTDRDESTKIRSKNKSEERVGLESDLEVFMESDRVAAGWTEGEREAWS